MGRYFNSSSLVRNIDLAIKKEYKDFADAIIDILDALWTRKRVGLGKISTNINTINNLHAFAMKCITALSQEWLINTLNEKVEQRHEARKTGKEISPKSWIDDEKLNEFERKVRELQWALTETIKAIEQKNADKANRKKEKESKKSIKIMEKTARRQEKTTKRRAALEAKLLQEKEMENIHQWEEIEAIKEFKGNVRVFLQMLCTIEFIHPVDQSVGDNKIYTMFRFNNNGEFEVWPLSLHETFNADDISFWNNTLYRSGGRKKTKPLSFKSLLEPLYDHERSIYQQNPTLSRKPIFNDENYWFNNKKLIERWFFFSLLEKLCKEVNVGYINNAGRLTL